MDYKNSNKALAVTLSILFHAAFVCSAAFLPLYFSAQNDAKNVNEIDVAVVGEGVAPETGSALPEETEAAIPAPEPAPIAEAKAEVTVTRTVIAPRPVLKPAIQPAPKRVMVAKEKSPATVEDSQAVIEVGDSLNEDGANTIEDRANETETATPAAEAEQAPVAEAPKAAPVETPKAPIADAQKPTPAVAPIAAAAPTETKAGGQNGQVEGKPAATQEKPQNFLTLKQAPGNRPPTYSREMRLQKLEGKGQLAYNVSKDGKVTDIKVNKSSGVPALDQAAVAAFSRYKFVPGQEGYTLHNFEFTLQGPAETDGLRLRTSYQEK